MSSYGSKLLDWMGKEGLHNSELEKYFLSGAKDSEKYNVAMMFRSVENKKLEQPQHNKENEMTYLVPYVENDGSFCYVNRLTGKVEVSVFKQPNGLFSFYGPKKWMEILGGRGNLSGIVERMSDGNYFNKG